MFKTYNRTALCGTVYSAPQFSHRNHGQDFFTFILRIPRLSGQEDLLRIIAGQTLLESCSPAVGDTVTILGQLRSFNNKSGEGSRLVISVFAHSLQPGGDVPQNVIRLQGVLCKEPVLRRTPMGREICDVILAVNRRYGRADYLPCIAWGAVAQQVAQLQVGDLYALEGRIQSRIYHKLEDGVPVEHTAYEVSVMRPLQGAEFSPDAL